MLTVDYNIERSGDGEAFVTSLQDSGRHLLESALLPATNQDSVSTT